MATAPSDEDLREAARHRGFRLVKSRVKTPGKADHGKYGLIDAQGAPVFGQDPAAPRRLMSTAADVAAFLREGVASTWAASVEASPTRQPSKRPKPIADEAATPSVLRPRKRLRRRIEEPAPAVRPARPSKDVRRARRSDGDHAQSGDRAVRPTPREPVRASPPPTLAIRRPAREDAVAVADLLALVPGTPDPRRVAAMLAKRGADIRIAERGGVIGVVAWSVIPTLHRGPIGRISLIVVAEDQRRTGAGRALLAEAVERMRHAGAVLIEVVSDIEIRNSHRFLRDLGFEQTSYRFARKP